MLSVFSGWKTIIGYLLLSIPGITATPMFRDALEKAISDPSKENLVNVAVQFILALGIADRVRKNLGGKR